MPNRITSFLISHGDTHQVEAVVRADRAANSVERTVASTRNQVARLISKSTNWIELYQGVRPLLHRLPDQIRAKLDKQFRAMVLWSYKRTGRVLRETLPTDYLRAAARRKITASGVTSRLTRFHDSAGRVLEDTPAPSMGVVDLALTALGLRATSHLDPFAEPAHEKLPNDEQRQLFAKLLFPPPPQDWINGVLRTMLGYQTWYQALDSNARKAEYGPEHLANLIATSYSLGKTQKEITEQIKPYFDGLGWRAARTARTFGLAIAGATQREMHDQLGDLMIGQMVRATLDERTRPAHRLRSGTVYYKEPKEGQLGYDAMPNPPLESDGSLAWNCRCFPRAGARTAVVGPR